MVSERVRIVSCWERMMASRSAVEDEAYESTAEVEESEGLSISHSPVFSHSTLRSGKDSDILR